MDCERYTLELNQVVGGQGLKKINDVSKKESHFRDGASNEKLRRFYLTCILASC